jgi:hypothetical protein
MGRAVGALAAAAGGVAGGVAAGGVIAAGGAGVGLVAGGAPSATPDDKQAAMIGNHRRIFELPLNSHPPNTDQPRGASLAIALSA